MRVKYHQIRANVAFKKPLTIHLMHSKGDFSCHDLARRHAYFSVEMFFFFILLEFFGSVRLNESIFVRGVMFRNNDFERTQHKTNARKHTKNTAILLDNCYN